MMIKYLLFTVIYSGGPPRRSRENKRELLTRLERRSVIGQNTDVTVAVAKLVRLPDRVHNILLIIQIYFIYGTLIYGIKYFFYLILFVFICFETI